VYHDGQQSNEGQRDLRYELVVSSVIVRAEWQRGQSRVHAYSRALARDGREIRWKWKSYGGHSLRRLEQRGDLPFSRVGRGEPTA
jgi:hypothetical protein